MARPSKYTDKLANAICKKIMEGESLLKICKSTTLPSRSTVNKWLSENKEFSDKYTRARERQADFYTEEMIDIADKVDAKSSSAVNKARLQIDARKWKASKLAPKKYGDRIIQEHQGELGINLIGMTDDELDVRIEQLIKQATS